MRIFTDISAAKGAALLWAFTLSPLSAFAQSSEALAAADSLMAAQNIEKIIDDMANATAASLPGATDTQRKAFVAEMTDAAFIGRFRYETRTAMAKHFTVDELNALADFYSRPVAKSAMAKMGPYTADVMSFVQREVPTMVLRMQARQ